MRPTRNLNSDLIYEKIDGQLTVFDTRQSALYTFNESAGFIYKRLKSRQTPAQISQAMQKHYELTI